MGLLALRRQTWRAGQAWGLSLALLVGAAAFALQPAAFVQAAVGVNTTMNYQGRLLTAGGAIVPDGTYNMQFKLYQDGDGTVAGNTAGTPAGSLLWTENWLNSATQGVTVRNGYFAVNLGSVTPLTPAFFNQNTLYLSVNIGGTTTGAPSYDGEMLPMKKLTASPYAQNAGLLGGLSAAQFLQLAPSSAQADATTNSSLAINKTAATGNILQLQRGGVDVALISNNGDLTLKSAANSTTSLAVKTADSSVTVLAVDTVNQRVTLANNVWLSGTDSTGTGVVNGIKINANNELQVGAALNVDGGITLPADAGLVTLADLPVTSAAAAAAPMGYSLRIGSTNALTVYGEADGAGNAQNLRVAIGTSVAPLYPLDVTGDVNSSTGYRIAGTSICTATGCVAASGSANYIQNSTTQQTGNINLLGSSGTTALSIRANGGNGLSVVNGSGNPAFTVSGSGGTSALQGMGITVLNTGTTVLSLQGLSGQFGDLMSNTIGGTNVSGINNTGQFYNRSGSFAGTLAQGSLTASRTYTFPDATGTVCLTTTCASGGTGSYIQNGTAQQAANFNIVSSTSSSIAAIIQAASGQSVDTLQVKTSGGVNALRVSNNGAINVNGSVAGAVNLTVTAAASQTADILQFQSNGGTVLGGFNASGQRYSQSGSYTGTMAQATLSANQTYTFPDATGTVCLTTTCASGGTGSYIQNGTAQQSAANFHIQSAAVGSVTGILMNVASQTADLLQLTDSSTNVMTRFDTSGFLHLDRAAATTDSVLTARVAGDTNDRFQLQGDGTLNWGGGSAAMDVILRRSGTGFLSLTGGSGFNITGNMAIASSSAAMATAIGQATVVSGQKLTVNTQAAANIGLVVKGVASQSGDLLQLQNSTGTVLSKFDAAGNLTAPNITAAGALAVTGTSSLSGAVNINGATPTSGSVLNSQATLAAGNGSVISAQTTNSTLNQSGNVSNNNLFNNVSMASIQGSGTSNNGTYIANENGLNIANSVSLTNSYTSIVRAYGNVSSSGNVDALRNFSSTLYVTGGGNIGSLYGYYAQSPFISNSSTITNSYGLYAAAQKISGVTNGYGVYQAGSTDTNVLNGATAINNTLTVTSAAAANVGLMVKGAASQTGDILQITNSAGGVMAKFNSGGSLTAANLTSNDTLTVVNGSTLSGSVGVGMAPGSYRLNVLGANASIAQFVSPASNNGYVDINATTTGYRVGFNLQDAGTTKWQFGKQTDNSFFLYDATNDILPLKVTTAGNVALSDGGGSTGIGTAAPTAQLHVVAFAASKVGAIIKGASGQTADLLQIQDSSGTNKLRFTSSYDLRVAGSVVANTTPDIAETIPAAADVTTADVVMADPDNTERVVKAVGGYNGTAVGVIADGTSGFIINSHAHSTAAELTGKPLALAGRVQVKITSENGAVRPGDYLTTSATKPGYAMKATAAGATIGKALGFFDPAAGSTTTGTVLVFVNLSYYNSTSGAAIQNQDASFTSLMIAGRATIAELEVTGMAHVAGDLTVGGTIKAQSIELAGHLKTRGDKPVVAAGAASCGATVTVEGTDTAGMITITTGATCTAAKGALAKLTFNKPFDQAPRVSVTPADENAASLKYYYDAAATSTTDWTLATSSQPAAGTTYRYSYQVIE